MYNITLLCDIKKTHMSIKKEVNHVAIGIISLGIGLIVGVPIGTYMIAPALEREKQEHTICVTKLPIHNKGVSTNKTYSV